MRSWFGAILLPCLLSVALPISEDRVSGSLQLSTREKGAPACANVVSLFEGSVADDSGSPSPSVALIKSFFSILQSYLNGDWDALRSVLSFEASRVIDRSDVDRALASRLKKMTASLTKGSMLPVTELTETLFIRCVMLQQLPSLHSRLTVADPLVVSLYRNGLSQTAKTLYDRGFVNWAQHFHARAADGTNLAHFAISHGKDCSLLKHLIHILREHFLRLIEQPNKKGVKPLELAYYLNDPGVIAAIDDAMAVYGTKMYPAPEDLAEKLRSDTELTKEILEKMATRYEALESSLVWDQTRPKHQSAPSMSSPSCSLIDGFIIALIFSYMSMLLI